MSDDESEYDGQYKRVWGLKFKQPNNNLFGLNMERMSEMPELYLFIAIGLIPGIGMASVTGLMLPSMLDRHKNEYCIDEQFWKAGVIASVLQLISLTVMFLVL